MTLEQTNASAPLVVQRWRRYGHDRAYVKAGADDLGYRDLVTGIVHCKDAANAGSVQAATLDMFEHANEAKRATEYRPRHSAEAEPAPAKQLLPDRDLASNVPGQAVREIAKELRDAAPVKAFLSRVVGAKTDERAHRIGADGEVKVARALTKLGNGWRVLHAVPVGNRKSDIDHVLIGPAGVFTINTKNHPGAKVWVGGDVVRINGFSQPYVRNSRHEAKRAGRLLTNAVGSDVHVRSIVAIVGAQSMTVKEQPADVLVAKYREMIKHLRELPTILTAAQIEAIYTQARCLSTWQPATVALRESITVHT